MFDFLLRAAAVVVFVIGLVAIGSWIEHGRLPAPGWVCWDVTRSTAAGSDRGARCDLETGWHAEKWPNGETVAVPDRAQIIRRRYDIVRD
jgi:hypothetical protein